MLKNKWVKIPYLVILYAFAGIGFFLSVSYLAIQLKWTNESGSVDKNHRYLNYLEKKKSSFDNLDSMSYNRLKKETLERIVTLNRFYPENANQILSVFKDEKNLNEAIKMLDVMDLTLKKDIYYTNEVKKLKFKFKPINRAKKNAIEWMNMSEWYDFKIAVAKDKKLIDSVARLTGVESRLIVSCLVGEQIRLFNSDREAYKKWIGPLKILSVESQFSLGVTGIKEHTAQKIESLLKDSSSVFYLGKKYEKLLDFKSKNIQEERFNRLTSFRNHFYSYMYAAVFLKQMKHQWERMGHSIENRPEILATLFNVGFPQSKPNKSPKIGGSTIEIKGKKYTFGMISYQFYYSGELNNLFPINKQKFDWNEV